MELLDNIDRLLTSWGVNPNTAGRLDQFVAFALVLVLALTADLVCRRVLPKVVARLAAKTKATWDDILFNRNVMVFLSHMVAPVIIYLSLPAVFARTDSAILGFVHRLCFIYIIFAFLLFVNSFLKAAYTVCSGKESMRGRPLKGLLQTLQAVLWAVGTIVMASELLGRSPLSLLTGLGASAAVLMLVFKDSIMGFVSGVQLSANDMLKVGDWISIPKYGIDGTVFEVTLNTVKVRNWDNTITTLPPYLLVSDSFQNWRGMVESGGRRVKRSVSIDMTSIRFCTPEMLGEYRKIRLLSDCLGQAEAGAGGGAAADRWRLTNLGVFRAYLTAYLKNLPAVNTGLTCMVRHLQPTEHGLPVELYFFSAVKDWTLYEGIQADIFEHVLAVIPEFDLRVFQSPTGDDLRLLAEISRNPCRTGTDVAGNAS